MATCRDCEFFMLAKGIENQRGERCIFCPLQNMTVHPSDIPCHAFRSAYEGVFIELPPEPGR